MIELKNIDLSKVSIREQYKRKQPKKKLNIGEH